MFKDIRETLNQKLLAYGQKKELYDDIYIGYICCSDYNKEVKKEDKLNHIYAASKEGKIEQEILEQSEKWIEQNTEKTLGNVIEQTGRFTEKILFSRLDNIEAEDVLDLARDLAFYINHVDISGNDENRIKLLSCFYSFSNVFKSRKKINCYNYTDEQIAGMLLGVLSNKCIENSEILDLKIVNPEKLKKTEDFSDNNIVISMNDDYYKYTVNLDTYRNSSTFGLQGNGLNNKIIDQRIYPDRIKRGNVDYNKYLEISKDIDAECR